MNKYSPERTRELYNKVKIDILSILLPSLKSENKIINTNSTFLEEFIQVLQINKPLAQKVVILRDELGGFKEPKDLIKLPEITNIEWKKWKEEGVIITVN